MGSSLEIFEQDVGGDCQLQPENHFPFRFICRQDGPTWTGADCDESDHVDVPGWGECIGHVITGVRVLSE